MSKEIIVEIDGFQIKANSLYKLKDKPDSTAPSGLKALGTTKIPSEEVEEVIPGSRFIGTDPSNPTKGIWDTGLFEESPCYATTDKEKVQDIVSNLSKHVVEPYSKKYGLENDLSHTDDNYWSNKSVKIRSGKVFNTANIDDLLDLYLMVRNYAVTPSGREGDPKYSQSAYVVVDSDANVDYRKEIVDHEFDAMENFTEIYSESPEKLTNILYYIGVKVADNINKKSLRFVFKEFLNKEENNAKNFNILVDQVENDSKVEEKVNLFKILSDLNKKEVGVRRNNNGKYYYNSTEIGESLKQAAENLVLNKDLVEIKEEIFDIK